MNIKYIYDTNVDDYQALRNDAGWTKLLKEDAQNGLDNSFIKVSAFDNELCVGVARLLWDKGYFAFISDVIVKKDYQGKGIGKMMVQMLIDELTKNIKEGHKVKIELIPAVDKTPFYEKFGFETKLETTHDRAMAKTIYK